MNELVDEVLDPRKYRCIRCKAPADIIFKGMLPYCFPHEPAESKAARLPKEGKMEEIVAQDVTTDVVSEKLLASTPIVKQAVSVGGGWAVNAKDGSELHNGFASKKDASKWASLEVEGKRLKAGQYKIVKVG